MSTSPIVTYITVSAHRAEASDEVLRDVRARAIIDGPIHLCRELPRDASPLALPSPLTAETTDALHTTVVETWTTDVVWLARAVDRLSDSIQVSRLIVRVPWPPTAETEEALLLARLSLPSLRIAVPLEPANAEEIFWYFNRLAFSWIALPSATSTSTAWPSVLTTLVRHWCLDARTRTPLEPVLSAFGLVMTRRLGRDTPGWRYRVLDADGMTVSPLARWTPSVHAVLTATAGQGVTALLGTLRDYDREWMAALSALCDKLDLSRFGDTALAPAAAAGRGTL